MTDGVVSEFEMSGSSVREGASKRVSAHVLHAREKQTRRRPASSEHQQASVRLGMYCMNALMLCV